MSEPQTIGSQIKEARKLLNLTQAQLADKSRITVFTISALEQSKATDCSTYVIRRLQKALNIIFEL